MDLIDARLAEFASGIDCLLNMIPSKHYYPSEIEYESKYTKNKTVVTKQTIKKAKQDKLDPEHSTAPAIVPVLIPSTSSTDPSSKKSGRQQQQQHFTPLPPSASISELRVRLKARIEKLQSTRAPTSTDDVADAPLVPRSRQEILAARLKKKEDRLKKKQNKARKTGLASPVGGSGAAAAATLNVGGCGGKSVLASVGIKRKAATDADVVRQDVSFGLIEFGDDHLAKKRKGPTDAAGRLAVLKAKTQKMQKLAQKNPERAASIAESQTWDKLIAKAGGEKVRDDEKLLEKTIKREKKIKDKKGREWAGRKEHVARGIADKQKKRNANIQKRADSVKDAKKTKAAKKR